MAAIGVLAATQEDREQIKLRLGELGHAADVVGRLDEALESARERRPGAFVIVDGDGADAGQLARELLRAFPLLPVLVALKRRDAARAVELMRLGAAEVVGPPWTPESLRACVSKSLRWQGTALTPLRVVPRRRSAAWYALAVGVFLSSALAAASFRRMEAARAAAAAKVDRWELPSQHPAGLAFDGRSLWVVDWFSQSLYEHSREDARVLSVRHLTAETPVAAAFTPEAVWTASADGSASRRMKDAKLTPLQRVPKGAPSAAGLVFDGLYVWTLDQRARVLRKRVPDAELSVVSTHRVPGVKPVGLAWDGSALWTLDAGDRALRRHDARRPEESLEYVPLPEYEDGRYAPAGLAWDGERFWTVAERRGLTAPALLIRHAARGAGR